VYGPLGIRRLITTNLELSRSPLAYKFNVHEIVPAQMQYPEDWASWPTRLECDSETRLEQTSRRIERHEKSGDWPLFDEGGIRVSAGAIMHRIPSFAYVIEGRDEPGSLNVEMLRSLGLPPGPKYAKLKKGETVATDSGSVIRPKDVLGKSKKGKKLVVLGDTNDTRLIEEMSADCDLIVHEATMENALREKAIEFGHSTPAMAADFAHKVRAKKLCLTHVSPRYKPYSEEEEEMMEGDEKSAGEEKETGGGGGGERSKSAKILLEEARQRMKELGSDCRVFIAQDFYELAV
jgi:ribonuclease Z